MATITEDYKEKLKEALNSDYTDYEVVRWIEQNFPELKESEDERIKENIITYLSTVEDKELIPYETWIAWLEKQGEQILANSAKNCKDEQKPAEWSEEDEMIALSIEQVMNCASLLNIVPEKIDKIRTWLKSLKDRVQPKQELSKEDEVTRNALINLVEMYYGGCIDKSEKNRLLSWLKSLKQRIIEKKLSIIDTLEVKEVDLEKEIDKWYNNEASKEFEDVLYEDIEKCAEHFFELGLKAQKGE